MSEWKPKRFWKKVDVVSLEKSISNKTKAIFPVHLYGHVVDPEKLKKVSLKYEFKVSSL